jgi:hypothetical protein
MSTSEQHCRFEMEGDRLVCQKCKVSLPGTLKQPVGRKCGIVTPGEGPGGQRNDRAKSGPCIHEGEPAGLVECRTCSGKVQIKTFACESADVPQPRAAWSDKSLPEDVAKCGGCIFYLPRKLPVPTHEGKACHGCGEPATQLCGFNGIFVCGAPLCGRCEHTGPGEHGPRKGKPTAAGTSADPPARDASGAE